MSEEITNTVNATTPVATDVVNEPNTVVDNQEPLTTPQENIEGSQVENSNEGGEQVQGTEGNDQAAQQHEPTVQELQNRIKEYELRDEEDRMIREQLGIADVDQQTFNYMNLDQQVVNMGKQDYLRLCNEYGIDANPQKLDASLEALKQSDPAKAYEFQRRFENLSDAVINKRQQIRQENTYYEINKFSNDYAQILNAAPALNNIMTQYVQTYGRNSGNMYGELQSVMELVLPAYQEAFNAGKQYALQDKAMKDTSGVQGGIATANANTYTPNGTFTREQISKMSTEEFTKYEKDIMQQMREGKIH